MPISGPNHLSVLGIVHTAISILALIAGFYASFRFGKINPLKGVGKWYTILTVLTCLTAFPIMKTGHFTGAHGLGVMVLIMLLLAIYARSLRILGNKAKYVETVLMSGTLFFSMIPAIVETLTRLPVSSPVATDPGSPAIISCLTVLIIAFAMGVVYQVRNLKADRGVEITQTAR
jgi:hypothetical protein